MAHGELTHIDIPADDLERAKRFYEEIFGWDIAQLPDMPDFELFMSGPGDAGGGIGIRGKTAPQQARTYFLVDSIEDALAKAERLGGRIIVPRTEVPGHGFFAALTDSEGNEIGLWEHLPA